MKRILIAASLAAGLCTVLLPVSSLAGSDTTTDTNAGKCNSSTGSGSTKDTGIGKGVQNTDPGTQDTGIGKGTPANANPGNNTTDTNGKPADCP
jgi:hypothetical protein